MDEWTDVWTGGWMNGLMDGWIDENTDNGHVFSFIFRKLLLKRMKVQLLLQTVKVSHRLFMLMYLQR